MTTHYGRKVRRGREIERENAINSGHYILPATSKGSAHPPLGPNTIEWPGYFKNMSAGINILELQ